MWLGECVGRATRCDQQRGGAHRDRLVQPGRRRARDRATARTAWAAAERRAEQNSIIARLWARAAPIASSTSPECSQLHNRELWNVLKISWLAKPSRSSARPRSSAMKPPVAAKFLRAMISAASTSRYSAERWRAASRSNVPSRSRSCSIGSPVWRNSLTAGVGQRRDSIAHRRVGVVAQPVRRLHDVGVGVVHRQSRGVVRPQRPVGRVSAITSVLHPARWPGSVVWCARRRFARPPPRSSTTTMVTTAAIDKCSPEQRPAPHHRQRRLGQLHLTRFGDPGRAIPAYQAKKPRNIENTAVYPNAAHCGTGGVEAGPAGGDDRHGPRHRRTEHQCPTDHLPATELPRQHRPFGVSDRRRQHGEDQQRVGGVQRAASFVDDVGNDRAEPDCAARPVRASTAVRRRAAPQAPLWPVAADR